MSGPASTPAPATKVDPAAWLKSHPKAAMGAAAAGLVAVVALASRKSGTTVDQGATDPSEAAAGTSATDLYNTLQPELENVGSRIDDMSAATSAGLNTVSGQVSTVSGQVATVSKQVSGVSAQIKAKPKPARPGKARKPKHHRTHKPAPKGRKPVGRPVAPRAAAPAKAKTSKPTARSVAALVRPKAKPVQAHPAAHHPAGHRPSPAMKTRRA